MQMPEPGSTNLQGEKVRKKKALLDRQKVQATEVTQTFMNINYFTLHTQCAKFRWVKYILYTLPKEEKSPPTTFRPLPDLVKRNEFLTLDPFKTRLPWDFTPLI